MMILVVSVFPIQAIALLSSASVVTDKNGLIYMRARYYSPDMKRFINADIVPGQPNNAVTLNRYAYANANPVMFVDPMGLMGIGIGIAIGATVLGLLAIGLSASSKQDDAVSDVDSEPQPTPNTKTYTREEAEKAALAGIDVPSDRIVDNRGKHSFINDGPTYIPSPYNINNESTNNSTTTSSEFVEDLLIKTKEQGNDMLYEWTGEALDKWVKKDYVLDPNIIPPSHYMDAFSKYSSFLTLGYDIYNIVTENNNAGNPWQETVSDVGIEFVGFAWSMGMGYLGGVIGSMIPSGAGTIIFVAAFSIFANTVYDSVFAPSFDEFYDYD